MQDLCDPHRVSLLDLVGTYHNGVWGSCDSLLLDDWLDPPKALVAFVAAAPNNP